MLSVVNPPELGQPKGYSNGILAPANSQTLYVAGMVGWNAQKVFAQGFVAQFRLALENVLTVVKAAGKQASSLARLTIYVVDKHEYSACQREVGDVYRDLMGRHFPARALVEVNSLLEEKARVEIEATAVLLP